MKKYTFPLFAMLLLLLNSCGGDDGPDLVTDNFDRQAMLRHWADNYILPAYQSLVSHTTALEAEAEAFTNDPSLDQLASLRNSWWSAYVLWQRVSMLEVGRADELSLRNQFNVYPIDTEGLRANLLAETTSFELPSNLDKQGFGALDYLLYGLADTPTGTLHFYDTDADASKYRAYLLACVQRIQSLSAEVLTSWENGYRDDFIANDGASATAAVDQFTNAFVFYYEKALRAGKIGIPAGVFSGNPLATHVEAPYYGQNRELALTALDAFRDFFNGQSFDGTTSGPSYAQYLEELQAAKDGTNIAALINTQFDESRNQLLNLNENLAAQVQTDNQAMLMAYDELQRNVVLLKVDMLQALSIAVTYVDADGD